MAGISRRTALRAAWGTIAAAPVLATALASRAQSNNQGGNDTRPALTIGVQSSLRSRAATKVIFGLANVRLAAIG
jgi:hypothetical protein